MRRDFLGAHTGASAQPSVFKKGVYNINEQTKAKPNAAVNSSKLPLDLLFYLCFSLWHHLKPGDTAAYASTQQAVDGKPIIKRETDRSTTPSTMLLFLIAENEAMPTTPRLPPPRAYRSRQCLTYTASDTYFTTQCARGCMVEKTTVMIPSAIMDRAE